MSTIESYLPSIEQTKIIISIKKMLKIYSAYLLDSHQVKGSSIDFCKRKFFLPHVWFWMHSKSCVIHNITEKVLGKGETSSTRNNTSYRQYWIDCIPFTKISFSPDNSIDREPCNKMTTGAPNPAQQHHSNLSRPSQFIHAHTRYK